VALPVDLIGTIFLGRVVPPLADDDAGCVLGGLAGFVERNPPPRTGQRDASGKPGETGADDMNAAPLAHIRPWRNTSHNLRDFDRLTRTLGARQPASSSASSIAR